MCCSQSSRALKRVQFHSVQSPLQIVLEAGSKWNCPSIHKETFLPVTWRTAIADKMMGGSGSRGSSSDSYESIVRYDDACSPSNTSIIISSISDSAATCQNMLDIICGVIWNSCRLPSNKSIITCAQPKASQLRSEPTSNVDYPAGHWHRTLS